MAEKMGMGIVKKWNQLENNYGMIKKIYKTKQRKNV